MKVQAGWLYKGPRQNEQSQGFYVPISDNRGRLHLVDTYMVRNLYHGREIEKASMDILQYGTGDHSELIREMRYSCYYGYRNVHLCVDNNLPQGFKPLCYLPDWEYVSDPENYDSRDVCGPIQLYFEHGYNRYGYVHGVMLKRKHAQKSKAMEIKARIASANELMTPPRADRFQLRQAAQLKKEAEKLPDDVESLYGQAVRRNELLERMSNEYMAGGYRAYVVCVNGVTNVFVDDVVEFQGSVEELRDVLRMHAEFMDRIDEMPEEGGEL